MNDGQVEWDAGMPLQRIMRNKVLIWGFVIAGVIAMAAYDRLAPPLYGANMTILLPPSTETSSNPLAKLVKDTQSPGDILAGILNSRNMRTRLGTKYNRDPRKVEIKVENVANEGQLKISASDRSKDVALGMVVAAESELKRIRQEQNSQLSNTRSVLLKKQVEIRESKLYEVTQRLVKYQTEMKTAPDPLTPYMGTKTLVDMNMAKLELKKLDEEIAYKTASYRKQARMSATLPTQLPINDDRKKVQEIELELRTQQIVYGDSHPTIVRLKEQLKIAKQALQKSAAEQMQSLSMGLPSDLIELGARREVLRIQVQTLTEMSKNAPQEAVNMAALQAELQSQAALLQQAKAQYEQVLMDGQVDRVAWSTLDQPYLEPEPVNRALPRAVIMGAFLGFLLGVGASTWKAARETKGK